MIQVVLALAGQFFNDLPESIVTPLHNINRQTGPTQATATWHE